MAYQIKWSDEFTEETLREDLWSIETGGTGFGNNEDQFYTSNPKNLRIESGKLIIEAHKEDYENRAYTSSKITTYNKQSIQYGKVVVRAKIPAGVGTWPAIWLLPNSIKAGAPWPQCGEIDLMEHVGWDHEEIHFSLHTEVYNHKKKSQYTYHQQFPGITEKFADYTLIWTDRFIEFLVDDISYAKFEKGKENRDDSHAGWPFDEPYFLILNLAIGGYWGGKIDDAIFPVRMEVEFVKVYEFME